MYNLFYHARGECRPPIGREDTPPFRSSPEKRYEINVLFTAGHFQTPPVTLSSKEEAS